MTIRAEAQSDLAIPPGEYLEEVISELGMTKTELAKRMNRPAPKLSAMFTGAKAIQPDTALQLEKVVGVPAHIWTGLEAEYRLTLARQETERQTQRLREERGLVTKFCYARLANLGFVAKKTRPTEKVLELQLYFGVTSLRNILELKRYQTAFRTGARGKKKRSPEAVAAWLRIGELQAQKASCAPFKKDAFEHALPTLRRMTRQPPEAFETNLHKILAEVGVALVLCPHLPKTYAHGATFWLGPNKAVLMLTLRGAWADIFWFSLFHEIGHLLLHDRHAVFLEDDDANAPFQTKEEEADAFAAETLIPSDEYRKFVEAGVFYPADIQRFAKRLEIDPGIVVGRMQHEEHLKKSWHNNLRTRYEWR
ncbi:MAG: HigA family addiction module antidote protein [Candidatus Latescibacteria bacterium]|nr:HigA family addiction module antidote protein [Candidatus Latescibacterota bacterium]MCK5379848.1 HigA family addiction module antidote protein [Candidatus Latescibacterota bacterium]